MDPQQQPFEITSATERGGYVVNVDGELDMCRVPDLEHALEVAGRMSSAKVLLDLERVTFIDGRAVGALAMAARRFANDKTDFQITHARGQVARILSLTGAGAELPLSDRPRGRSLPRPFGIDFLSGPRASL